MAFTHLEFIIKLEIPHIHGYKVKDVGRWPKYGEWYIFYDDDDDWWQTPLKARFGETRGYDKSRYVILAPDQIEVEEVTFTPTGETRIPKQGEWFRVTNSKDYNSYAQQASSNDYRYPYEIVERSVATRKVPNPEA